MLNAGWCGQCLFAPVLEEVSYLLIFSVSCSGIDRMSVYSLLMEKLPERPIYMAVFSTLTPEAKPIGYTIISVQELINPTI